MKMHQVSGTIQGTYTNVTYDQEKTHEFGGMVARTEVTNKIIMMAFEPDVRVLQPGQSF